MLTPTQLDNLPKNITVLYAELEEQIIADMARRIVKTDFATLSAQWELSRLQALGACQEDIFNRLKKLTGKTKKELKVMFNEAAMTTYSTDKELYEKAGYSPSPLKTNKQLQNIIAAGLTKTNNLFDNLTKTTAKTATQQFERALDTAYMQIVSGAFDYNTAIRTSITSLAQVGVESIKYPSGHIDKLDVAVRRAALTGVSQTTGKMTEAFADEMNCDLVLTTAHFGARPEHAKWQGKIFSRSGTSTKYPDFKSSTGYGTGAGLKGWNCHHDFGAFFEGLSTNPYSPERLEELKSRTVEYDDKTMSEYDASQKQRFMERNIRATRRELAGYDAGINAATDDTLKQNLQTSFDLKSVKLKRQEAKLKDFCRQTGLRNESARVQTYGFNKSVSQKAVIKAENHYKKWLKDIGAETNTPKSLAEYYKNKYNDTWEHKLLIGYNKAVKIGDISPLVGFDNYIKTAQEANSILIGITTKNGFTVEAYTTHFIDRVIGQVSTSHSNMKLGVPVDAVKNCLVSPCETSKEYIRNFKKKGEIIEDTRINFISNDCSAAFSITENKIIQVNSRS